MRKFRLLLVALMPLLFLFFLHAEVKLPALVSDHMVIQQNVPVRIWGTASPQEEVTVTFRSQRLIDRADASGKWQVFLAPMAAGGPYDMKVNQLTVKDVLVGEVWVGSGQSNMEFAVARGKNATEEIAHANYPQIRLFTVKRAVADAPVSDVQGFWAVCTPETVKNFSAVAYFFGREINQTQHLPVGLIHSSWGGTPAQAWTESSFLEDDAALQPYQTDWQKMLVDYPAQKTDYDAALTKWEQANRTKTEGAKPPIRPAAPQGPGSPNTPAGLYNAMIAPLTPYAIRGVLWYQGEANGTVKESFLYRRLFTSMIESWRQAWGQGEFPFYFVQLANFRTNGWWALLRESQTRALDLRNTGMALAIDVGNPSDVHPTDKQTVAHRLALAARAQTYGEKLVYSGPMYRQMTTEGNAAKLWFDSVGTGLEAHGGTLTGFAVAGANQQFFPATAKIVGNNVVVSSPEVQEPVAVRYGWADNPAISLYNREGLPANPFRTDAWKQPKGLPMVAAPAGTQ